jgi:carboxymethylenebutenolidase
MVMRFTHSIEMDWMLSGVAAASQSVEFAMVGIIQLQADKIANERLYWDQATALSQLGYCIIRWRRRELAAR